MVGFTLLTELLNATYSVNLCKKLHHNAYRKRFFERLIELGVIFCSRCDCYLRV